MTKKTSLLWPVLTINEKTMKRQTKTSDTNHIKTFKTQANVKPKKFTLTFESLRQKTTTNQ